MKYIKKQIPVEVVQWTGKDKDVVSMYNFLENKNKHASRGLPLEGDNFIIKLDNGGCQMGSLYIKTLEGNMKANVGDYIIKGVKGEFYPCKPDIFEASYEPYEEKTAEQMFGEAGFKLNLLETDKNYIQYDYIHEKEVTMSIIFCVEGKVYDIDTPKNHAIEMDLKTHKAINKQIQELGGWE